MMENFFNFLNRKSGDAIRGDRKASGRSARSSPVRGPEVSRFRSGTVIWSAGGDLLGKWPGSARSLYGESRCGTSSRTW